jgi:hypothetical protein
MNLINLFEQGVCLVKTAYARRQVAAALRHDGLKRPVADEPPRALHRIPRARIAIDNLTGRTDIACA